MVEKITAIKGMNDIGPADSWAWEWLEAQLRDVMSLHGYRNVRTPVLESTALFVRGLGEVTDVVEKEMYCFEDKLNGEHLTLRPENTAGVVRAAIEHSWLYEGAKRLYYTGPMFRHERPQRGRYRQFHQFGAECLGFAGVDIEAELILMACSLWQRLGLKDVKLEINSIGTLVERQAYRSVLIQYFEQHLEVLDEDAKRRLHLNPLRILDTKNPAMQDLVNHAPKLFDCLGAESLQRFDRLKHLLDANQVAYVVNHRLVRGLDYYNNLVFEFTTTQLGSQGTICAGGRYDTLTEQMGGKPTPAVGWALGMERILELLRENQRLPSAPKPDVYAVVGDEACHAIVFRLVQHFRRAGLSVWMHTSGADGLGSLKSQFKKANQSGAACALIVVQTELQAGQVAIKPLRAAGSEVQDNVQQAFASTDVQSMVRFIESHRNESV
jgi:histidyl-tRNA synthetase